jgi:hypothetical protein
VQYAHTYLQNATEKVELTSQRKPPPKKTITENNREREKKEREKND